MDPLSAVAIIVALGLKGLAALPPECLFPLALPLVVWHTVLEEPFGAGGPFWDYYRRCFGLGPALRPLVGFGLFCGLAAALAALAVFGLLYGSAFAAGALVGAMAADALVSHLLLRAVFPGPNPGLLTATLYLAFVALAVACGVPVTAAGLVCGAGAFVGFWAVSFALKRGG